jgi:hypothetical protein
VGVEWYAVGRREYDGIELWWVASGRGGVEGCPRSVVALRVGGVIQAAGPPAAHRKPQQWLDLR